MLKELWGITHHLVNFSLCLLSKLVTLELRRFNPLSANPTKWSNTLKQFVSKS